MSRPGIAADSPAFIAPNPVMGQIITVQGLAAIGLAWAGSLAWFVGMERILEQIRPKPMYQVATLNLLGDGSSPFEFLPRADLAFMAKYEKMEYEAANLRWEDVQEYLDLMDQRSLPHYFKEALEGLKRHCIKVENRQRVRYDGGSDKIVWSYFQPQIFAEPWVPQKVKRVLGNDNKVKCQQRMNMLTFANARIPEGLVAARPDIFKQRMQFYTVLKDGTLVRVVSAEQQWHLNVARAGKATWLDLFGTLLNMSDSYLVPARGDGRRYKDGMLALFDFVSNIVCSKSRDEHVRLSARSIFNPANYEANVNEFFQVASTSTLGLPVLIGLQEWPDSRENQEKCREVLRRYNMSVAAAGYLSSVAVAYSDSLSIRRLTASGEKSDRDSGLVQPRAVFDEVVRRLGKQAELEDKKSDLAKLVATTSRKTMAVRVFGAEGLQGITFIVIHAKEPKTKESARILAHYVQALADALPKPWVVAGDMNLGSKVERTFGEVFRSSGSLVLPSRPISTTAKMRSMLQGQTDDRRKCQVLVEESKDRLIAGGDITFARDAIVYPDITRGRTLPQAEWPSDHCIVISFIKETFLR